MSRTGTFPGNFVARADVHGTDSDAELARQLQAIEVEHAAQDLDTASDEVIARSMQLQEEERVQAARAAQAKVASKSVLKASTKSNASSPCMC